MGEKHTSIQGKEEKNSPVVRPNQHSCNAKFDEDRLAANSVRVQRNGR